MTESSPPQLGLDFVARVLASLEEKSAPAVQTAPPDTGPDEGLVPFLQAAAVLVSFDPDTLRPAGGGEADPEMGRGLLDYSKLVLDEQRQTRWTLRYEERRRVLQELASRPGGFEKALEANREQSSGDGDALQRTFRDALLGHLPLAEKQDREQLAATIRLHDWVHGIVKLEPLSAYRQRFELLNLLEPFRHLTGRRVDGKWVDYFRGRESELAQLRRYAGVVSHGLFEQIGNAIPRLLPIRSLREAPPLLIHGPGGMGKSTLLARFLLQHAEALATERFPFVYLDFDRPGISAQEPITLLCEAARQLAVQYPAHEPARADPGKIESFEDFQRHWQLEVARGAQPREPAVTRDSARDASRRRHRLQEALDDFARVYHRLAVSGKPLLIVLDTFEEVQYRSRDQAKQVYELLEDLQRRIPFLRAVLAGRAPITEFPTHPLELGELDPLAARGFLENQGVSDPEVAEVVAEHVGGNPLSLRLAADLLQREGTLEELEQELTPGRRLLLFRERFKETEVQGRLFRRILGHIHDPSVRRLAHPGMVLRRVTPELIRYVLAEPCGVAVPDDTRAQQLFDELAKEVSLVTPTADGVLQPRADVRQAMLELIRTSEPEKVVQIHQAAVEFYQDRPGAIARTEEIYHRLAMGESPRSVDLRWTPEVEANLARSVGELPPRSQAYLAAKAGIDLNDEVWRVADLEDWEHNAARRARDLIGMGRADEALDVLRQRTERSADSPIFGLESIAGEQSAIDRKADGVRPRRKRSR